MEPLELVKLIAAAAAEKKATQIVAQKIEGRSSLCDYQIICSGGSERQTQAIASYIDDHLRELKAAKPMAIEGKQTGHWILMDYGSVMIHIFLDSIRDYYALERLWPNAETLHFDS